MLDLVALLIPHAEGVGILVLLTARPAFTPDPKRQTAKVGRLLHRLHALGLVAKFPHSRRWRTTRLGRRLVATAIQIREINFPQLLALAA